MRLFISYSNHDRDFASRLCNDLILYNVDVWFDELSILPGESIPDAIQMGISTSSFVTVLLSNKAIGSKWVSEEINTTLYGAISKGTPLLIPLLLDRCEIPPMLKHRKHLDFSNEASYEDNFTKLVNFLLSDNEEKFNTPVLPGFRELKILGEGGFSTVYKAAEADTYAVKAIKMPKGRHTFGVELAIAEKLNGHPNIVPIERAIVYKNRQLLVMPYAGYSLKWFIQHRKIMPDQIEAIVAWMTKVFGALEYAHSKGVLHCDVKPSNILIDEIGEIRLVDFGIGQKIHYVQFKQSTIVRGTIGYLSPEQQLAEKLSPASDIYSAGAVMYELLTSEKPIGRFKDPSQYNPTIPKSLEAIVIKCLERNPIDRFASAEQVISAMKKINFKANQDIVSGNIVGTNEALKQALKRAELAAKSTSRIFIFGETGTGKELLARYIHNVVCKIASRNVPFVPVNCAAIPENLFEAQMFGFVKGAYSSANKDTQGMVSHANGGILLLDEINSMPLTSQAKLLRLIEYGEFHPLGSDKTMKVDIKIISCTNSNLRRMVENGTFREDLFFRLNVVSIELPALRERKDDIPALAFHFIQSILSKNEQQLPPTLTADAIRVLQEHNWPGNIREFRNVIERLMIFARDAATFDADDIIRVLSTRQEKFDSEILGDGTLSLKEVVKRAEKGAILRAFQITRGNIAEAAKLLGLQRTYLYEKMKNLGIDLNQE